MTLTKSVDNETSDEELVECIDSDEDDEIVMELGEDALEVRVDSVEGEVEPSEKIPKKQLFKNISTVLDERNIQKLSLQQDKTFVYENKALKKKGKKITWYTHPNT